MAIDMRRPLFAAIQAALDEVQAESHKKRHGVGAGRALLIGAGLYTAGRAVTRGRGRGLLDAIQQRLPEQDGDRAEGFDDVDDEFDEDEPEGAAEEDFDDEADEDFDDEPEPQAEDVADEPEAEADDEPEAEEDASEDESPEDADEEEAPAGKRTRGRSNARSRR